MNTIILVILRSLAIEHLVEEKWTACFFQEKYAQEGPRMSGDDNVL